MGGKNSVEFSQTTLRNGQYSIEKIEYKWIIDNFPIHADIGKEISSKVFDVEVEGQKDQWQIIVYPGGYTKRVSDFVSLWLKRISTNERLIRFVCAVLDGESKEVVKKRIRKKMSLESVVGWSSFCSRRTLLDKNVLKDKQLTIRCVLEVYEDRAISDPEFESNEVKISRELTLDFEGLWSAGWHRDFVIMTRDGEAIKVHKCILAARSSVFRAMFESGMMTRAHKQMTVDDISGSTMRSFLQFLYYGSICVLDCESAEDLLYAADKYDVGSLKALCSKVLVNGISMDNSIHFLLLADRHHDEELKHATITFLAKNMAQTQQTTQWIKLMKERPELANFVVQCLMLQRQSHK